MSPFLVAGLVFLSVFGAALLALWLSVLLPSHHRSAETRDIVKLAMGLLATTTALVLGMLVVTAKSSYDAKKANVTAMAAKIAFLDRILDMYGPEATAARQAVRGGVELMVAHLWPETATQPAQMNPNTASGEAAYRAIQELSPKSDEQRALKAEALGIAYDIGQMRWLLFEQADTSISGVMLAVVVCWVGVLFFSFGLFAPRNITIVTTLGITALSVAGAIFLILELDQPFGGVISISSRPMVSALNHSGN